MKEPAMEVPPVNTGSIVMNYKSMKEAKFMSIY